MIKPRQRLQKCSDSKAAPDIWIRNGQIMFWTTLFAAVTLQSPHESLQCSNDQRIALIDNEHIEEHGFFAANVDSTNIGKGVHRLVGGTYFCYHV